MPAPTKGALSSSIDGFFSGAGLKGENAPDLATAVSESLADALSMFASMAKIEPGIPAAVDPITSAGATTGPGKFMAPPAGGPGASALESMVLGALQGNGLEGENIPDLAAAIASSIAFGIEEFCNNVQVAPGIAIAGAVTAAPGTLL